VFVRDAGHHVRPVSQPDLQTTPALRFWQGRALAAMDRWERGPFLLSAAPGAGKTRPAWGFDSVAVMYARIAKTPGPVGASSDPADAGNRR
jgi:hypothetical protein